MVNIRSVDEIILDLIDFFRIIQPDLDTKPGTIARDLFIEAPATQLSLLYNELSIISDKQSLRAASGNDLDKLAQNFGITRTQANASSGTALLTFSSINGPILINKGAQITSKNGISFIVNNTLSVFPASINYYKSIATKFRNELDIAGISDNYAVEVTVTSSYPGNSGNIGKYSLNKTNITGVSGVTNVSAFSGGTDQENDLSFRNRILAAFSGSSIGTALGYRNAAISIEGVNDAYVITPGDPLMTRDGAIVTTNNDGSKTIVSEGSGGKVDIVILGSNLQDNIDSFIYRDKSNNNDPTDVKNNIVLGQISGDESKTINRKRIDNISNEQLPQQPVNTVIQVVGSISGGNFVEKTVDQYGRVHGNYEIIKDTGPYAGSPWGFDTFRWISNKISLFEDNKIKNLFNGQDPATFTGVLEIPKAQQAVLITNENSKVTSDRSIIQLLHTPATSVTRVLNLNTGERYFVLNQNVDSTTNYNTTGRIKISGNTLPSPTDILQVDYTWIIDYDQYLDYDGLYGTKNIRSVTDSIDWGYSSIVRDEKINFKLDTITNSFIGNTTHPINSIVYAKKFNEIDAIINQNNSSGLFAERLFVEINNLSSPVISIDSIKIKNSNIEIYNTSDKNGNFSNQAYLYGNITLYSCKIILPTDIDNSIINTKVTVLFNGSDTYTKDNISGNFSGMEINIPYDHISTLANNIVLLVSYIAEVSEFYSSPIISLPSNRNGNGYILNNNFYKNNYLMNSINREYLSVKINGSNQFYIDLNNYYTDFKIDASDIISIIRVSDGLELWNQDNIGSVTISNSGNYQIILSGYNNPVISNKVCILYYAKDLRKFQPTTFYNKAINYFITECYYDNVINKFKVNLNNFSHENNIGFSIIEPNTDIVLFSTNNAAIINNISNAILSCYLPGQSGTVASIMNKNNNYLTVTGLTGMTLNSVGNILKISGAANSYNNGNFLIVAFNSSSSVDILNENGIALDANNSNILWQESFNLNSIIGIKNKKIKIFNSSLNNNGLYDIENFNILNNEIIITNSFENINKNQISIIKLSDGNEIWDNNSQIDISNNNLIISNNFNSVIINNDKVILIVYNFYNLKTTPSRISSTITDQFLNPGTISIKGTTLYKIENYIITNTSSGLKLNLSDAVRKFLGLNSVTLIPKNIKIARIVKIEKVKTAGQNNDEVISVDNIYDLKNTKINNNTFYCDDFISDDNLSNFECILPNTIKNTLIGSVNNIPIAGDKFRVTIYISVEDDYENLSYTSNGTLYSNKKFITIDKIFSNSGFKNSQSTRISLSFFNQPNSGSRYKMYYDYIAPKQNERISITYNYNKLISDVTFNVEKNRPINSDVIVKEAKKIKVDVTMNIVINNNFASSQTNIIQNVKDKINNALVFNTLGGTIDQISLINIAQGTQGVARARILIFNKSGNIGQVLKISAQNDEYIVPNNVIINTETR